MFGDIFNQLLDRRLNREGGTGQHGTHFLNAAGIAQSVLVPALSDFISTSVTSFPSSSTQLGVVVDFSTGVPVSRVDRLGPIFAETAGTIGERRVAFGMNATILDLNRIRGEDVESMRFRFLHVDVNDDGVGNPAFERDVLMVEPNLDLDASIFGFHAIYGLTPSFDIGISVPVVSLEARGNAVGTVDTTAFPFHLHNYGGTTTDPVLTTEYAYSDSEVTIPNIAIRAKYRFPQQSFGLAVIGEVQVPVAGEETMLGEQPLVARVLLIGSKSMGRFNPHLNLGYDARTDEEDRLNFTLGFDTNLAPTVNIAAGIIGRYNMGERLRMYDPDADEGGPGSREQTFRDGNGRLVRVDFSNIPDKSDGSLLGTVGSRFIFSSRIQGFVNLLIPITSGGLQSSFAPTAGLAAYF